MVVRDVVWRKVSPEAALADYGVVLTGSLDDDTLGVRRGRDRAAARPAAAATAPEQAFFHRGPGYAQLSGGAEVADVDWL